MPEVKKTLLIALENTLKTLYLLCEKERQEQDENSRREAHVMGKPPTAQDEVAAVLANLAEMILDKECVLHVKN